MTLFSEVLAVLRERRVAHALIGGMAMAAHGVARATLDTDLLVVDRGVLDRDLWTTATPSGAGCDVRLGDDEDPLAGLVRITRGGEVVDIVVGRSPWQRELLVRAKELETADGPVPVVDLADLILLKLYAGGPQDLLDVDLLLANVDESISAEVEKRVSAAPQSIQDRWQDRRS